MILFLDIVSELSSIKKNLDDTKKDVDIFIGYRYIRILKICQKLPTTLNKLPYLQK